MEDFDPKIVQREVRKVSELITHLSEIADADSLLKLYSDNLDFVAFGSDGVKRTFDEFKTVCNDYYKTLKKQKFETVDENFYVVGSDIVISSWFGNIHAYLKSGATMDMKNCGVTNVFKKDSGEWKVIHSHESALLPKYLKNR